MIMFENNNGDYEVTVGGELTELISETEKVISAIVDAISEKHKIEEYRILAIINKDIEYDIENRKREYDEFWEMFRNLIENGD